jgi:hypothetical protein
MEKMREKNEPLSITHIIAFLKSNNSDWVKSYIESKNINNAYDSLSRLCRNFAKRNKFNWRRANSSSSKLTRSELSSIRTEFTREFWCEYNEFDDENIINIDETGVFYDTPPRYIWAKAGESSAISSAEKNSSRLTAVLGIRRNGKFLINSIKQYT